MLASGRPFVLCVPGTIGRPCRPVGCQSIQPLNWPKFRTVFVSVLVWKNVLVSGSEQGAAPRPRTAEAVVAAVVAPPAPAKSYSWLLLLGCVALALPGLLVQLQQPDVVDAQEIVTLSTSVQWARWLVTVPSGRPPIDLLIPRLNEQPQLSSPPAMHWLHVTVWSVAGVLDARVPVLILVARLMSVALALITVAAVFWAGHSVGGQRCAAFAAIVCAANPALLYYGRLASPPIAFAAASAVAIAGGLWATRPLKAAPSVERQFIGWVICGLAMGFAMLSHGWVSLIMTAGPLLVILVLLPQRAGHVMGLLAAMLIAVLLAGPWALITQEELGKAIPTWLSQVGSGLGSGTGSLAQRLSLALAVLMPWTLWLLGALLQPFSSSSAGDRGRLFLGWSWFVAATALYVTLPATRSWEYVLAVVPAGSVLVGQLFSRYAELSAAGRHPRTWQILRWFFLALLAAASLLPIAAMYGADQHWLGHQWIASTPANTLLLISLAVLLLLVLGLSARWVLGQFPGRALLAWAMWMVLFVVVICVPVSRAPALRNPARSAAAVLASFQDQPLFWLSSEDDVLFLRSLLLYTGRPLGVLDADQFAAMLQHLRRPVLVLLPGCTPQAMPSALDSHRLLTQVLPDRSLWAISPGAMGTTQSSRAVAPAATRGDQ